MSPVGRTWRFSGVYGRRFAILVASVVLVAIHLAKRSRSKGDDPDHRDLDPEAFHEVVNRPDVYTLDVHVPEQRHVEGTDAFVPYDSIRDHRDLLPDDRTTPIALYCRSDDMSREVAGVLSELGYEEIHHLRGGIRAWEERDLPLSAHRFGEPGVRAVTSGSDEAAPDAGSRP